MSNSEENTRRGDAPVCMEETPGVTISRSAAARAIGDAQAALRTLSMDLREREGERDHLLDKLARVVGDIRHIKDNMASRADDLRSLGV